MTLYDTVVSNLKGVIGSNKDGLSLNSIASEYEFFVGHPFPINQLGYDSILSFLKSVPHLFKIKYTGNATRIYNLVGKNESESNLILYNMIQNTTAKKGPKFRRMPFLSNHKSFVSNNSGSNSSFSYNNYTKSSNNGSLNGFATNGFSSFSSNKVQSFENFKIQVDNNLNKNHKQLNTKDDFYLSDSETSSDSNVNDSFTSVGIQTEEIKYKKLSTTLSTLKTSNFVDILIEIIIEFKPLNLDSIVFFNIRSDLYYYFCLFTGINISPGLFTNIVRDALVTLKTDEFYEDLIYGDDTGKYCCLNLFSTNFTLFQLPHLEFNANANYCVEVLAVTPDAICAVKFRDDSVLRWSKSRPLSDEAKMLIETQQFWSWIPGSLCLVQLPHSIVYSHNLLSIERAIIVSTEFATPIEVIKSKSNHLILHKTSFYLVDHKRYVPNVLSTGSSFQVVKRTAYKNNESNIANVCNVSIRARCMPSKIQFVKIHNFNDVSHILRNSSGGYMSNQTLILYRCQKSEMMINFQSIFSCYSRINKNEFECNRVIENYNDDVVKTPIQSIKKKITGNKMRSDDIEVIIISDSDEDNSNEVIDLTRSSKRATKHSTSSYEDEAVIAKTKTQPIKNVTVVVNSNKSINNSVKPDEEDRISVISFTDDELVEKVSTVSSNSNENGEQSETRDNCVEEPAEELESQSEQKLGKCIIPITSNLCSHFNERVVRILHLQSGAAVVTLLESTSLMKRELKMLSIFNQELAIIADDISIGDYFIWCSNEEIDYIKTINNKTMALVEILQVINDDMALVSLVHHGLIINVKRDDLRIIPKLNSANDDFADLIGPLIGAFDLHMIPNWYCADLDKSITDQLFTAFFINENELVLQYFNDPCKFYNLQLLPAIEISLTNNHCNTRSKSFISMLSESLLNCRLFVGNLLVLSTAITEEISINSSLPVSNTLVRVAQDDEPGIWFASIDAVNECGELIDKLSPHCFAEEKFCIDRVEINKKKNKLRLLDHQNIYVEIPEYFQGIYKFERKLLNEFMKSNTEFMCRYMLLGATEIPDLNFLYNKLIF